MKRLLFAGAVALLFAACGHGSSKQDAGPTLTDAGCYLHP
jgi:hypothetical protein